MRLGVNRGEEFEEAWGLSRKLGVNHNTPPPPFFHKC